MLWLMGLSLIICLGLILILTGKITWQGVQTFWPRPVERVTLAGGETLLGVLVREQEFEEVDEHGALTTATRRLYRTGNREFIAPFRWVNLRDITDAEPAAGAVFLERTDWGPWIGIPAAVVRQEAQVFAADAPLPTIEARGRVETEIVETLADGSRRVRVRTYLGEGEEAWEALRELHPAAAERSSQIAALTKHELGRINRRFDSLRLRVRQAEIDLMRAQAGQSPGLAWGPWAGLAAAVVACALGAWRFRRARPGLSAAALSARRAARAAFVIAALAGALALWLESPRTTTMNEARLAEIRAETAREHAALEDEYRAVMAKIDAIREEDERFRAVVNDPLSGRFAPKSLSQREEPMLLSQIVRAVRPNELSFAAKVGVYFDRWGEFIAGEPRNANSEGGVFPVIFGTVVMTILLSILVVPLGVIAALYLREYARQSLLTSSVRIAVNNLAGVPSIVYGVFGLGFFCYALGGFVDSGPSSPLPRPAWWFMVGGVGLLLVAAITIGGMLRAARREELGRRGRRLALAGALAWAGAAVLVAALAVTTPYFHGLFEAALPSSTYGSRGILWASLTLALLTLPVVIVATEEAVAAVPSSMREGSYGCGAGKWQTIRRVVLPQAMPGIMTGMILAMARGAGEVAPLMLVGAVKLAPTLPLSTEPPFVHLERSFMHLGFHIYDLAFQSPDAESSRPLVWTTTLLLLAVVLLLNLTAITIRARIRARMGGTTH